MVDRLAEAAGKIIIALDVSKLESKNYSVSGLMNELGDRVGCVKIGLELITAIGGPEAVKFVRSYGGDVFYDGKFADIPNTVGKASAAAIQQGVSMLNVHASCGINAMRRAVDEAEGRSLVLAVTVLTSLSEEDVWSIYHTSSEQKVFEFALDAHEAGCDGIICSPKELGILSNEPALKKMLRVTPGVRPTWAAKNDQKRVMTPAEAIASGADYVVIGRPITDPPPEIGNPTEAVVKIAEEIASVL